MKTEHVGLLVIGAGPAGQKGAIQGAKGGLKRKQHRNQVARDLIARLDDCYFIVVVLGWSHNWIAEIVIRMEDC